MESAKGVHPEQPEDAAHDLSFQLLSERSVDEVMETVVSVAVSAGPAIRDASVSLRARTTGHFATISATSPDVKAVDEVQYRSRLGPCVQAIDLGVEVRSGLPNPNWPDFSAAAQRVALRSVWSLPLPVGEEVIGALNLYSSDAEPWEPRSETMDLLARQAAALLSNALALSRSEQLNATLRQALETRTVIGQAQGVLMGRQRITADEAFDILRRASQRTNRKLRDVALDIVRSVSQGPHSQ
jgi:GAF domain-containing protein